MPPLHKRLRCCDSALAAAQGKLYLLGGSCHLEVRPTVDTGLLVVITGPSQLEMTVCSAEQHHTVVSGQCWCVPCQVLE